MKAKQMPEEAVPAMDEIPLEQKTGMDGILPQMEPGNNDPTVDPTAKAEVEPGKNKSIDAMLNVGMNIQIILGYSQMPIADLLKLSRGSVIELDKRIGEPVDVVINQSLVARGDLVKVGDNRIGISLTEIVKDHILES